MSKKDVKRLVAVKKSYERKSKLPHYDLWNRAKRFYNLRFEELRLVTKECAEASKPDTLALDAACGDGVYSSMLSKKGYKVVALDLSTGLLKRARELVNDSNVQFVRGSITHLPLRENKFNLVLCVNTLLNLTDSFLSKTLDEFRRVIKCGGVSITDTRNTLNFAKFWRLYIADRRWAEIGKGGLTLKARSLMNMKKIMGRHHFKIDKTKGIGLPLDLLAPIILFVSEAI